MYFEARVLHVMGNFHNIQSFVGVRVGWCGRGSSGVLGRRHFVSAFFSNGETCDVVKLSKNEICPYQYTSFYTRISRLMSPKAEGLIIPKHRVAWKLKNVNYSVWVFGMCGL